VGYAENTMRLRWACAAVLGVASVAAQENTGSIAGRVVDATNLGIPSATVAIVGPVDLAAATDRAGKFFVTGLAPGTYKLRIEAPGFRSKDLEVSVEAGKEMSLDHVVLEVKAPACLGDGNKPRISEIDLPFGGEPEVSGTARGEQAGAVEDVVIRLVADGTSNVVAATRSDQKGGFKFSGVKPGVYYLEVSLSGSEFTRVPRLRVRQGHALEVLLTWQPGELCL
jgi:hypothetical protein